MSKVKPVVVDEVWLASSEKRARDSSLACHWGGGASMSVDFTVRRTCCLLAKGYPGRNVNEMRRTRHVDPGLARVRPRPITLNPLPMALV